MYIDERKLTQSVSQQLKYLSARRTTLITEYKTYARSLRVKK